MRRGSRTAKDLKPEAWENKECLRSLEEWKMVGEGKWQQPQMHAEGDSIIFRDGPAVQAPGQGGRGGRERGEGVILAEGWPHLRRGTMLCPLASPPLRPLPIGGSPSQALNGVPWTTTPLLCLQRTSNSGNWEPVGWLSDTSMDCQQGRHFQASRDMWPSSGPTT